MTQKKTKNKKAIRRIGTPTLGTLHRTSQGQPEFSKPLGEAVVHPENSKLGLELPARDMGNPEELERQGSPGNWGAPTAT